jgi:UDP-glucose 4-epimerase
MKVAVTGGSGQLGTVVLRRLLRDRSIKSVVSIDLVPPMLVLGKLRFVRADVRDPEIGQHLAGSDVLVHLAFMVTQRADRSVFDEVNVTGSENVFRAAIAGGVKHILYSSSIAAYGIVPGHPVPITEDTSRIYQPDFAYAATKYRVEALLDQIETEHPDVVITRLRPALLLGARTGHGLAPALDQGVLLDRGSTPLPMVWDEDVAEALYLALKQRAGGAFNLCADELLSARELSLRMGLRAIKLPAGALEVLQKGLAALGVAEPMDPAWLRSTNVPMIVSSERAKSVLGWKPSARTAVDVMARYQAVSRGRVDRRVAAFMRLVDFASQRAPVIEGLRRAQEDVHLCLEGRGGGDFTLAVRDGKIRVTPGIPRPPTTTVTMHKDIFLGVVAGRVEASTAEFTGKIRVQGAPMASMMVPAMARMFRKQAERQDAVGKVARAFKRWLDPAPAPQSEPSQGESA